MGKLKKWAEEVLPDGRVVAGIDDGLVSLYSHWMDGGGGDAKTLANEATFRAAKLTQREKNEISSRLSLCRPSS